MGRDEQKANYFFESYQVQLSTALNPHQRSCFLQWMVVNTETHNWSKCRELSDYGVLSPKQDIYILFTPCQGSENTEDTEEDCYKTMTEQLHL